LFSVLGDSSLSNFTYFDYNFGVVSESDSDFSIFSSLATLELTCVSCSCSVSKHGVQYISFSQSWHSTVAIRSPHLLQLISNSFVPSAIFLNLLYKIYLSIYLYLSRYNLISTWWCNSGSSFAMIWWSKLEFKRSDRKWDKVGLRYCSKRIVWSAAGSSWAVEAGSLSSSFEEPSSASESILLES